MKKFLPLFIFVFSAAVFGQIDLPKNDKTDDINGKTSLPDLSKPAVKMGGNEAALKQAEIEPVVKQTGDESAVKKVGDESVVKGADDESALKKAGDESVVKGADDESALKKAGDGSIVKQSGDESALAQAGNEFVVKRSVDESAFKRSGDESVARVLDDELTILGYSVPARLSILGDVGRENNWNRKVIFKGHSDPKNRAYNRGIISWQGTRLKKLNSYLKEEGLLGRGDDTELRGMARFMHTELQDEFPDVYKELANAKDTASASNALQKYIKYVPKRPYNSPDPDFKVRKNAVWAKKAMAMGLGQSPDASIRDTSSKAEPRDDSSKAPVDTKEG